MDMNYLQINKRLQLTVQAICYRIMQCGTGTFPDSTGNGADIPHFAGLRLVKPSSCPLPLLALTVHAFLSLKEG